MTPARHNRGTPEIDVRGVAQEGRARTRRSELVPFGAAIRQQRYYCHEQGGAQGPRKDRGRCRHQGLRVRRVLLCSTMVVAGKRRERHSARRRPDGQHAAGGPHFQAFRRAGLISMAVYTEVTDEALAEFLADYDIGSVVAFRGIAEGVENSNFSLRTTAGDFILTLYEKRVDPADLPWFLGLMEHLAKRGIVCPLPVHGRDGVALRQLCGRHAAVTTFLPGVWPRRVRPEHCGPLGAALAALHVAGGGYAPTRPNALGPAGWAPLLERSRARADEVQPGLADELDRALRSILVAWPRDLPVGHIHADLFPDNVFFLDGRLSGLIDFYFAATDILTYDLAVCLNAWCFEPDHSFNATKARNMLSAYAAIRSLSAAERAALPVLCQGAAIRFLLTRLFDWLNTPAGAMVTRKDPLEFLRRLRFHLAARSEHAYGI
jgi:homoserine kinase type II